MTRIDHPSTAATGRLYFVDALRALAILMMLQGHFIYALLGEPYRDPENAWYAAWLYGRGITAPLFFTVSGFIFVYLLVRKSYARPLANPRLRKGIRRGMQLIGIGYLLRLNALSLLTGRVNDGFWWVDVLQCIGFGLIFLVAVYALTFRGKGRLMALVLLIVGMLLFLLQPAYATWTLAAWPEALANYFTRAHGSVFTLIPWLGYSAWGGFLALLFHNLKPSEKTLNGLALAFALLGLLLVFHSSALLMWGYRHSGWSLFKSVAYNNFLFIRLGNVFLLLAVFMALRKGLRGKLVVEIGQRTLGIYILHFVILYGSWFGFGLDRYFYRALPPVPAVTGALVFMLAVTGAVLAWYRIRPLEASGERLSARLQRMPWKVRVYLRRRRLAGRISSRS